MHLHRIHLPAVFNISTPSLLEEFIKSFFVSAEPRPVYASSRVEAVRDMKRKFCQPPKQPLSFLTVKPFYTGS